MKREKKIKTYLFDHERFTRIKEKLELQIRKEILTKGKKKKKNKNDNIR